MEQDSRAIERLYEEESLTADLDDAPAKVLLDWGAGQLKSGRPQEWVWPALRTLVRLVHDRKQLTPAEARAKLQAAGLSGPAESALADLWTEMAFSEGEWAGRLVGSLTLSPSPPVVPSPPTPSPEASEEERKGRPWWQRLVFWRHWP